MDELARVAAATVGASRCVHVEKCPDGLYNKAYIFRTDDGREDIGKVPNPNAGPRHYTTAREVATMEFVCVPQSPLCASVTFLYSFMSVDAHRTLDTYP